MNPADETGAAWRRTILLLSLAVFTILAWAAYGTFMLGDVSVHAENGIMENSQAAMLLLSSLIGLHAAATTGCRIDRWVLLLVAWTCIGMTLRELDLDKIEAVPLWLARLSTGRGRTLTLVVGYLALGTGTAWEFRRHGRAVFGLLQRRPMVLLIAAALVLHVGRVFEKQTGLPHHEFLEETAEVLAYALVLLSVLWMWLQTRQRVLLGIVEGA